MHTPEAEGSLILEGHPGLHKIESVSKKSRAYTKVIRAFNPSIREMETGVMWLGREKNTKQKETGAQRQSEDCPGSQSGDRIAPSH